MLYRVTKGQDAYVNYMTVVEADTPATAALIAGSRNFDGTWVPTGAVPEFDDFTVYDDEVELLDDDTFEGAVKQLHEDYDFVDLQVTTAERNTILAALRFYQTRWTDPPNDEQMAAIDSIASDSGEELGPEAIDDLCEKINV